MRAQDWGGGPRPTTIPLPAWCEPVGTPGWPSALEQPRLPAGLGLCLVAAVQTTEMRRGLAVSFSSTGSEGRTGQSPHSSSWQTWTGGGKGRGHCKDQPQSQNCREKLGTSGRQSRTQLGRDRVHRNRTRMQGACVEGRAGRRVPARASEVGHGHGSRARAASPPAQWPCLRVFLAGGRVLATHQGAESV